MRIAAVHAHGFRNLDGRFPLASPLSVFVGENNAGKSNVIDACRLFYFSRKLDRVLDRGSLQRTSCMTASAIA